MINPDVEETRSKKEKFDKIATAVEHLREYCIDNGMSMDEGVMVAGAFISCTLDEMAASNPTAAEKCKFGVVTSLLSKDIS